ncbi:hypothetical protein MKZ38_005308 [Zalerion maritima]|uniref:Ecp2 effector protein domain-containing protein n=1 Tax=Zalerion maritima TaxID=339359 RepID=A0AAD5RR28_9PEZI|nr:hypothetical protein MKZ38_005308 [Zalerion maritima]
MAQIFFLPFLVICLIATATCAPNGHSSGILNREPSSRDMLALRSFTGENEDENGVFVHRSFKRSNITSRDKIDNSGMDSWAYTGKTGEDLCIRGYLWPGFRAYRPEGQHPKKSDCDTMTKLLLESGEEGWFWHGHWELAPESLAYAGRDGVEILSFRTCSFKLALDWEAWKGGIEGHAMFGTKDVARAVDWFLDIEGSFQCVGTADVLCSVSKNGQDTGKKQAQLKWGIGVEETKIGDIR